MTIRAQRFAAKTRTWLLIAGLTHCLSGSARSSAACGSMSSLPSPLR
jgi:hypothetical protein